MIVSNNNVNVSAKNQDTKNVSFNVKADNRAATSANNAEASNTAANNAVSSNQTAAVQSVQNNSENNESVSNVQAVNDNQAKVIEPAVKSTAQPENEAVAPRNVQAPVTVKQTTAEQPVVSKANNARVEETVNVESNAPVRANATITSTPKNVQNVAVKSAKSNVVADASVQKATPKANAEIDLTTVQGEESARGVASAAMDTVAPAMLNEARNDEKRDQELAEEVTANIKYEYNGQVVGTASESIQTGQTVDVSAHVPAGYQVSSSYQASTSVPVVNGVATFNVPVVKAQSASQAPAKITKDVINYTNNGKTVSSVTLPADGSPVNVSDHCPSGYQVDPSYQPQKVTGQNGVATFNVPVVPALQSTPSTGGSSSNTNIKDVINYIYNGKTISSVTENATGGSVDVSAHIPAGYQVAPNYQPGTVDVVNGVATFNVPVVPASQSSTPSTGSSSSQTISKDVIDYTYNGKTISTVTLPADGTNPVDVGAHLPSGYQLSPDYKPSTVSPVDGVATFNVPVVPSNSGSSSNNSGDNVHSSSSSEVQVTINYQYNGKTVGTATESVANNANIDVSSHLPQGYQVAPSYKPGSQNVSGNTATITVPVEPVSNSNTVKTTINYQYNGKTVGTATIENPKGQPVDVSKNVPAGYQVAPSFKPGDAKVVNGVATLDVPVVPSNGSNSGSSTSNSSSSNTGSTTSNTSNSSSSSSTTNSSSSNSSTSSSSTDSSSSSITTSSSETSSSDSSSSSSNSKTTTSSSSSSDESSNISSEGNSTGSGLAPATSGDKGTTISGNSSSSSQTSNSSNSGSNIEISNSQSGINSVPASQAKPTKVSDSNSSQSQSSSDKTNTSTSSASSNTTQVSDDQSKNSSNSSTSASESNNGSNSQSQAGQAQSQSQNGSKITVSDNGNVKTESTSNSGTADSIADLEKKTGLSADQIKKMLAEAEANGEHAQFQNEQQHVYHVGQQGQAVAEPAGSAVSAPVEETATAPAVSVASAPVSASVSGSAAPAGSSSSSNVSSSNALPETGMANEGVEFAAIALAMAGFSMLKREDKE